LQANIERLLCKGIYLAEKDALETFSALVVQIFETDLGLANGRCIRHDVGIVVALDLDGHVVAASRPSLRYWNAPHLGQADGVREVDFHRSGTSPGYRLPVAYEEAMAEVERDALDALRSAHAQGV
jgi:hypothetical protein